MPVEKKKNQDSFVLVGLTGGIGSGKSIVAGIIKKFGIPVINADDLSRELTATGSPTLDKIIQTFGSTFLTNDNSLNRGLLRKKIMGDALARKKLESILHPKIKELAQKKARALARSGKKFIVYEAPLLIEAGNYKDLQKIVCVIADDKIRISRIIARDNVSKKEAEKILNSQMPQNEKLKYCDYIIENNGTVEELEKVVKQCMAKLNPAINSF